MMWTLLLAAASLVGTDVGASRASVVMPDDAPVRDLNTHHCLVPPQSRAEWEARARSLRTQILVSAGLWPMPARTPLKPVVTGRIEREDFVVENVAIETMPGFRLCGNLYRPKGGKGPFPAIANPHGHWSHGRLEMQPDVERAAPLPAKPGDGRANLTAIGVNLARQGFVVFAYDMVGYNDTNQVNHQFAGSLERWFHGISLMGLQLWNSIRAVDYLCSLPDVDRNRVGVTGASGGGTQTFLLTAVDDRIKASVPVNMVSAYMQGGCLCENGPGLRLGTDNVEIAALAAPRPLLLICATGDWTSHVPKEEWPAIKAIYDLYGAGDRTACVQFNYGHNYNVESREAMYAFFARWLRNDPTRAHREYPFDLDASAMRVWNETTAAPKDRLGETDLADAILRRSRDALRGIWPKRPTDRRRFRQQMQPAIAAALGMASASVRVPRARDANTRAVLLVTVEGETPALAGQLREAIGARYRRVVPVQVPPMRITVDEWWKDFRSCYNPTPLALAAQQIVQRILELAAEHHQVDVIGLGSAGPAVLYARAVADMRGIVLADVSQVQGGAANRLECAYAPCLEALGGMGTAIALISPSPVFLTGASPDLAGILPDASFSTDALTVTLVGSRLDEVVHALTTARVR